LIGTTFGPGNGSTTFNLPDMRGQVAVGRLAGNPDYGSVGQVGGSGTVQHDHILDLGSTASNTGAAVESVFWASDSESAVGNTYIGNGSTTRSRLVRTMNDVTLSLFQPFVTLNFIICALP
jgi:microcystin-dependent protein